MKKGIYKDISNDEYHAGRSHLSSSVLKTALTDPRKYYSKYVLNEIQVEKYQSAFDFGTYIHAIILEPETLERDFAFWYGARKAGREWDQFEYDNQGKIIISKSQMTKADLMIKGFSETEIEVDGKSIFAPDLFTGGIAEQSYFTTLYDMPVKTRTDYIVGTTIRDVKTTSSDVTTPAKARKVAYDLGYDLSAALYVDVVKDLTGKDHTFELCFLSKQDYKCSVYKCSEELISGGRQKYIKAIETIKKWRETGVYFDKTIKEI